MITKVVGVTFSNEDGSSRARIIANMSESDQICLERDPYNKFDSNAVKVCVVINGERKQIGFLAKDLASEISPKLRRGVNFKATVNSCGIWNERPFCEIEVEEMTFTQILDKPLPNSAPAPRPVPPRPMTPKAAAQPSIPNKVLSDSNKNKLNRRMQNGTYGGVRGKETKVGQKLSFPDLLDFFNLYDKEGMPF